MNRIFEFIFRLVFLAGLALFLGSCTEDPLDPIDGADEREKFVGVWNVSDNALKLNYEVIIELSSSNSTLVVLQNFAGSGDVASGLVVGKTLVISGQTIGDNWYVNGTGTWISTDRLNFDYFLEIGGSQENRTAVFLK